MLSQLTVYHIIILIIGLLINLLTYGLFYIDKKRAIKNKTRISEKTLLTFSVLGAWIGMKQFRHKTQKVKFKVGVPIGLILSTFLLIFLLFI